jgi:hypothetical protein
LLATAFASPQGTCDRAPAALPIAILLFALGGAAGAQSPILVTIDPSSQRRAISPDIYGVNFADLADPDALSYPINRRGGNSTTRYNWRRDIHNTARDWFFMNIPNAVENEQALPAGSGMDHFLADSLAAGSRPILTLPLIGWAPRDERVKLWGFSVQEYGGQDATECTVTGGVFWCQPDAGNGFLAGNKLSGNDPHDTSMEIGASWVSDWLDHLEGSGVELFSLDNEPMLWSETHFDVHPQPTTYDELWNQTVAIASVVKSKRPDAKVLGPVVWGWCAYFHSAADGCFPGSDQAAHGGKPFLEWYLEQICAHQASTGIRLVDYLDVHYYPQGGQALSGEGNAAMQARRLRSVKDLYDPGYPSESWIPEAVRLVPRLRELIAGHCPGTKLAITEYNWGEDCVTCALAQAEVLAVFGREGVDLATRWGAPAADTLDEDAFRLFLDYDGNGSGVLGHSVAATSSAVDTVSSYAVDNGSGKLLLLLFNKSTASRTVSVNATVALGTSARLHRLGASQRLTDLGEVAISGSPWSLSLPARSASLFVLDAALPSPDLLFEDGFESGDRSSWSP